MGTSCPAAPVTAVGTSADPQTQVLEEAQRRCCAEDPESKGRQADLSLKHTTGVDS